jgi:SAM-dependent methyltransferase
MAGCSGHLRTLAVSGVLATALPNSSMDFIWDEFSGSHDLGDANMSGMIDVQEFLKSQTVEELNRSAEEYFSKITDWTYLLAKPFAQAEDCSKLLIEFWAALSGLNVCARMKVLDFGPGSCWTSHILTQMGCYVYACDVSASALEIGKARYLAHPPFGNQPAPEFLAYDGFRFPLPDNSIDRVLCMHALHHVPNVSQIIAEMGRVLVDTGIAAFAEPGPQHSKSPDSQAELRNGVLENDIVIEDIWNCAHAAGFQRLELTAFPIDRVTFSLESYNRFVAGDPEMDRMVVDPIRQHAIDTRTFFLCKEATPILSSTTARGLSAELDIRILSTHLRSADLIEADVRVVNKGAATWLPSGRGGGAVNLGFHLKNLQTGEYIHDYGRAPLAAIKRSVAPGEEVSTRIKIPTPDPGRYELVIDLVSEWVTWFAERTQSESASFEISVS